MTTTPLHRIRCSEVWGGIRFIDLDVCTGTLSASVYSHASEGGRGGDLYYFSVCDGDQLTRVAIADVVGHGDTVSRFRQWMYDALVEQMNSLDGHAVLGSLNRHACTRGLDAMTTAAVVGVYRRDSTMYFSCAGHPPVQVRRESDAAWWPVSPVRGGAANLPLGVSEDTAYPQERLPLEAGDRPFLYTDGLIEARDESGNLFGQERLLAVLNRTLEASPAQQKSEVLSAVERHSATFRTRDDVTLMVIEVL